jgi:hypothetical protein
MLAACKLGDRAAHVYHWAEIAPLLRAVAQHARVVIGFRSDTWLALFRTAPARRLQPGVYTITTCNVLYKTRLCQDSLGIDKNGTMEDKLRHCFHVNAQNTLRMAMDYTSSAIGKECGVAQVHVINVSLSR